MPFCLSLSCLNTFLFSPPYRESVEKVAGEWLQNNAPSTYEQQANRTRLVRLALLSQEQTAEEFFDAIVDWDILVGTIVYKEHLPVATFLQIELRIQVWGGLDVSD